LLVETSGPVWIFNYWSAPETANDLHASSLVARGFNLPYTGVPTSRDTGHSVVLHSSCRRFQPLLLRRVLTRRTLTSYIIFSSPGFQPGGDIGSKEIRTLVQCLYRYSESGDGLADKRGFLCWSRQLVMRILD
jgi:hypothetical protein